MSRNSPAIAFCLSPSRACWCPVCPPVQRCCSLRLREVWLRHRNFHAIFPQLSRNFCAFVPQFPAILAQISRNFRQFSQSDWTPADRNPPPPPLDPPPDCGTPRGGTRCRPGSQQDPDFLPGGSGMSAPPLHPGTRRGRLQRYTTVRFVQNGSGNLILAGASRRFAGLMNTLRQRLAERSGQHVLRLRPRDTWRAVGLPEGFWRVTTTVGLRPKRL